MKQTCWIIVIACLVIACKHSVQVPNSTGTGTGSGSTGNNGGNTGSNIVCFETDVLPIFKSSCAKSGCHDVQSRQDGYILDSYANIMKKGIKPFNANNSDIYEAITEDDNDDRMPKAPNPRLTAAQINIIKRWIDEGAQNTTNCGTACDTSLFTYSQAVRPILDANCVGCHNSATTSGNINLTLFSNVHSVAVSGRLLGAINHSAGYQPMPMGGNKLSACDIAKITKWVQAGASNN